MIGKNIKLLDPDSKERDLQGIVAIHFNFEKADNKIIDFGEGQINGNYHQIQIRFEDDANVVYVSVIPESQSSTALVGISPAYKGRALKFTIDQTDKNTMKKIMTTSTNDGSKWDVQYQSTGKGVSTIQVLGIDVAGYKIPDGVIIKDWGAKYDAKPWAAVAMTDPDKQGLWKVVDNQQSPKNIAAEFKSQIDAQAFINNFQNDPTKIPTQHPNGGNVGTTFTGKTIYKTTGRQATGGTNESPRYSL